MHDHIVDKGSRRIEHRRILRLPDRQSRNVIHREMLYRRQGARSAKANIPHMAHVKNAHAEPHRQMLGDDAARRIFDRHLPAVEIDHLGAHPAMGSVEGGDAGGRHVGRKRGQRNPDQKQWLGCQDRDR